MKITGFYLSPVRRISDADASVPDIVPPSVEMLVFSACAAAECHRPPPPAPAQRLTRLISHNFRESAPPPPPNKLVRNAPKLVQSVTISTQADLRTWEVLYSKELNNIVV